MTDGWVAAGGRPTTAGGPADGVGTEDGPTGPCKPFARIAGCKAGADVEGRLTGGARFHGTVGVHAVYTGCGWIKLCVSRVPTTREFAVRLRERR